MNVFRPMDLKRLLGGIGQKIGSKGFGASLRLVLAPLRHKAVITTSQHLRNLESTPDGWLSKHRALNQGIKPSEGIV